MVYFDSGVIVKLYVQEATSLDAVRLANGYTAPYPLTQWQALEVRNAMRLKAFRGEITLVEMSGSIAAFEQDIAAGRWQRPGYSVAEVERRSEDLSSSHSAALGCRTLDIIHVAAALAIGADEFVTFDARQRALAERLGFAVKP